MDGAVQKDTWSLHRIKMENMFASDYLDYTKNILLFINTLTSAVKVVCHAGLLNQS